MREIKGFATRIADDPETDFGIINQGISRACSGDSPRSILFLILLTGIPVILAHSVLVFVFPLHVIFAVFDLL